MKAMLINPSEKNMLENAGDRIPIGLLSMASYLQNAGVETKVYDLNHDSEEQMYQDFLESDNQAVGVSFYTSPNYQESLRVAKRFSGLTKVIAGGYHATFLPESVKPYVDAVVLGEGETGIYDAIFKRGIIKGQRLSGLQLPKIDYSLVDLSRYGINGNQGTIITSRGCPMGCSFCGKMEREIVFNSYENVFNDIENLERHFDSLYFLDDVFTINQERMKRIVEKVGVPFRVTTRANMLSPEKINILMQNGCSWVSMGIESGNDEILKQNNKGQTKDEVTQAIYNLSDRGINVKGFFIIGLPGETERTARDTIEYANAMKYEGLTSADFYYLTPFPGTPIWNNPESFGINIRDRDYTKYLQAGKTAKCVVDTKELKAERIEQLVEEARQTWKN